MVQQKYLPPVSGARWAISRYINNKLVCLIERSPVDDEAHIALIFGVLAIPPTPENEQWYFPKNRSGQRCPTLDLLELFAKLPPGTGEGVGV